MRIYPILLIVLFSLVFVPQALADDIPPLTGTIVDGNGVPYDKSIMLCQDDCLTTGSHNGYGDTSQYTFPEGGAFTFYTAPPAGSYVIGLDFLNLQPGYRYTRDDGYLLSLSNGTYTLTPNYFEATRFNVNAGGGAQLNGLVIAPPSGSEPPAQLKGVGGISGLSYPCTGVVYSMDNAPVNAMLAPGSVASYQWYMGGYSIEEMSPIPGATSASVIPPNEAADKVMALAITVVNPYRMTMYFSYNIGLVFSSQTNYNCKSATVNPLPKNYVKSWGKKVGVAKRGGVVKVVGAKANRPGVKFTYQWYINGKAVKGVAGKKSALRISNNKAMAKKTIYVKVTASKSLFKSRAMLIKFGRIR